jgi:mRNA interferase HigB
MQLNCSEVWWGCKRPFPLTVFNIGGNRYRLIARVEYEQQRVYIRHVLTHAEYDKGAWKNDPWNS